MRVKFMLLTFAFVLAVFVSVFAYNNPKNNGNVKKSYYVYKVIPLSQISDLESVLNQYGKDGWRMVQVEGSTGNLILEKKQYSIENKK